MFSPRVYISRDMVHMTDIRTACDYDFHKGEAVDHITVTAVREAATIWPAHL